MYVVNNENRASYYWTKNERVGKRKSLKGTCADGLKLSLWKAYGLDCVWKEGIEIQMCRYVDN